MPTKIKWLPDVEEHDYPAAESYLGLVDGPDQVRAIVARLRTAPVTHFKAKDIFRASRLSLLGVSNTHVDKDRERIKQGEGLSPLLLVRDPANGKVIIADGYHRLCAVYEADEDALVPCKIV
jgi:disulfide oxidoreductase YuzD